MKTLVIQAIAAVAIFFGGFFTHAHLAQVSTLKAEVKTANTSVVQTAQSAAKAQDTSMKVEAKIATTAANVEQNRVAIHKRVAAQIQRQVAADTNPTEKSHDAPPESPTCGRFYLDAGTVRLLNATRAGAAFHPTGSGDEAGDTAPALCFADFIDADVDLTKLYLDLAERHDTLVDSVEEFQKEQRARLGIKDELTQ